MAFHQSNHFLIFPADLLPLFLTLKIKMIMGIYNLFQIIQRENRFSTNWHLLAHKCLDMMFGSNMNQHFANCEDVGTLYNANYTTA